MIPLLVATIALLPLAFDAAPPKHEKPPCPADTVYYHVKVTREYVQPGIPVETVDTTWVVRSSPK